MTDHSGYYTQLEESIDENVDIVNTVVSATGGFAVGVLVGTSMALLAVVAIKRRKKRTMWTKSKKL